TNAGENGDVKRPAGENDHPEQTDARGAHLRRQQEATLHSGIDARMLWAHNPLYPKKTGASFLLIRLHYKVSGEVNRYYHREGNDDYKQPGDLFRSCPRRKSERYYL